MAKGLFLGPQMSPQICKGPSAAVREGSLSLEKSQIEPKKQWQIRLHTCVCTHTHDVTSVAVTHTCAAIPASTRSFFLNLCTRTDPFLMLTLTSACDTRPSGCLAQELGNRYRSAPFPVARTQDGGGGDPQAEAQGGARGSQAQVCVGSDRGRSLCLRLPGQHRPRGNLRFCSRAEHTQQLCAAFSSDLLSEQGWSKVQPQPKKPPSSPLGDLESNSSRRQPL